MLHGNQVSTLRSTSMWRFLGGGGQQVAWGGLNQHRSEAKQVKTLRMQVIKLLKFLFILFFYMLLGKEPVFTVYLLYSSFPVHRTAEVCFFCISFALFVYSFDTIACICACTFEFMCVCLCVYMCVYACACVYACVYTCACVCLCMCFHVHECVFMCFMGACVCM